MTKSQYTKLLTKYKNKHGDFAKEKAFFIDAYDHAKQLPKEDQNQCIEALINYAKNYGVK